MTSQINKRFRILLVILTLLIGINIFVGLASGSVSISFQEILAIFSGKDTDYAHIFWQIRFPRVLGGIFIGIFLALAGCILQTVLQNPIADPGVLGISSGASLAAVIIMLLFPGNIALLIPLSFIGGLMTYAIVALLTFQNGMKPIHVILAGISISAIWGGFQAILLTAYSDRLVGVMNWLNGNLGNLSWGDIRFLLILGTPAVILAVILSGKLNLLLLGDDVMHNLGVPAVFYRFLFSLVSVYLSAISVSFTGVIGFVGLIVPHIGRLLVGNNHFRLLPVTLLLGGNLLLGADTLSRIIIAPQEIPVGTVMSLLGGPFFLYLLVRHGKKGEI